jgi:hypothetical protein
MIPKIPRNLADVPVGDAYATALADALVHFLDNADQSVSRTFNARLLDLARDNAGRAYRCPQGALILAVHLADAVEALAEGATRAGDIDVVERERELRATSDEYDDDESNCLDLARVVRDESAKLRDAIERATDEARANVPCD